MKKLIAVLLLVAGSTLYAQIQITQSHMPVLNDTARYSVSSSNSLNFKQTGANFRWDYRQLNITSQDVYKFQSLLSTPYATLAFTGMPFGAIGYKIADSVGSGQTAIKNLYNFFDSKSASWSAVGTGFTLAALPIPAGGVYSDKDEIYQFPLNYNDFDSSTFKVTTVLGSQLIGSFMQKGYRLNKVEGWGKISTPYGDSIPCLKIKSTVIETDSLKITSASINLGFQANRVEYKWLSTSEKIPILEVVGTELGGTFTATGIRYRDNYRVPGPNPFAPRPNFSVNRVNGIAGRDSFKFTNLTVPLQGSNFTWQVSPNKGVRYVSNTTNTSQNPHMFFDSVGVFSVTLNASNIAGSRDTVFPNYIQIQANPSNALSAPQFAPSLVYPNPGKGLIHVSDKAWTGSRVLIFDMQGKLVHESILDESAQISTEQLNAGQYTLLLMRNPNITYTQFTIE